jgi:hypothetical protein
MPTSYWYPLPNISSPDVSRKNVVQGNALFIRAAYHYALAQLFAKAYNKSTASTDLGIAIRLTADIAVKPIRSTVSETYGSILKDLQITSVYSEYAFYLYFALSGRVKYTIGIPKTAPPRRASGKSRVRPTSTCSSRLPRLDI